MTKRSRVEKKDLMSLIIIGVLFAQIGLIFLHPSNLENMFLTSNSEERLNHYGIRIKTSGLWDLRGQTIIIDNEQGGSFPFPNPFPARITWAEAAAQPWCSGNGSWSNPYLIENVLIDGDTSYGFCFLIAFSTDYFMIRNCTVYSLQGSWAIQLYYANNGRLIENNCSFSSCGISLTKSHNNTITGNISHNNTLEGIYLENSDDNVILGNKVYNNANNGIYLLGTTMPSDECYRNKIQNNTIIYNNENGINLWCTVDTEVYRNNISFNDYGIKEHSWDRDVIYYNFFIGNNINAYDEQDHNDWNNTEIGNYWDDYNGIDANFDGIGDISYNISGPYGRKDYLPIYDPAPPLISNVLLSNNPLELGDSLTITANITDINGIDTVRLFLENPDEIIQELVFLYDDGLHNDGVELDGVYGNAWNSNSYPLGQYFIDIRVEDKSPEIYTKEIDNIANFTLINSENPSINEISELPDGNVGDNFQITCNVTDNGIIDSVIAYIQHPDNNIISTVLLLDDGNHNDGNAMDNVYSNIWDSTGFEIGYYYLDIFANDTSNNVNYTDNGDIFILSDTDGPLIQNVSLYMNRLELGDIQIITCNVSDPSGILNVSAIIKFSDESVVATIILYDDGNHNDSLYGDGIYSNVWDSDGARGGDYFVAIVAYDSSLAQNCRLLNNCLEFEIYENMQEIRQNVDQKENNNLIIALITTQFIISALLIGIVYLMKQTNSKKTKR